jgi:hypothetical protein
MAKRRTAFVRGGSQLRHKKDIAVASLDVGSWGADQTYHLGPRLLFMTPVADMP